MRVLGTMISNRTEGGKCVRSWPAQEIGIMVLATFIAIGMAAILLMLRFFFALDSEIRTERRRSAARVRRVSISAHRSPALAEGRNSALVQPVLDSSSRLRAIRGSASRTAFYRREDNSEVREA